MTLGAASTEVSGGGITKPNVQLSKYFSAGNYDISAGLMEY
jgi:hypothetical protein